MNFLKKILPWIGAAATGNVPALVNMAATEVSKALGTKVEATTDAISAAVAGATPEQLLALKQADNDFAAKMQAMGFQHETDLEKIAADDRASARSMQIQVRSWVPPALAVLVTCGFFGLLGLLLYHVAPAGSEKVLDVMTGSLGTAWLMIVTYYFGSSAGSERKTELMANNGGKES